MDLIFSHHHLTQKDKDDLQSSSRAWSGTSPVTMDRLALLTVSYKDFDGKTHADGQIMVMDALAENVLTIFKELYDQNFPLQTVQLASDFSDDSEAEEANCTYSYFDRLKIGDVDPSMHSYGAAIDLNPVQNPYLNYAADGETFVFLPKNSHIKYLNRSENRPGKDKRDGLVEPIVQIMRDNGFTVWGGDWDFPLDYHHFQIPIPLAELLAKQTPEDAKQTFAAHTRFYQHYKRDLLEDVKQSIKADNIVALYQEDPKAFMKRVL